MNHLLHGAVIDQDALRLVREKLQADGRTLVFTNGVFDILHSGHVSYLGFAREQGDVLAVGLNGDASVRRNKGDLRPINGEHERASVLVGLRAVDYVVIFDADEPRELIEHVLPHVLVKGRDWAHYVSGRDAVEGAGGRVVLADMIEGRSTTSTIERVRRAYGSSQ